MSENSDFLDRYLTPDEGGAADFSAPSPMEGVTDEVRFPDPGVGEPESPPAPDLGFPELRSTEGSFDPEKTAIYQRVRPSSMPAGPPPPQRGAHHLDEETGPPAGGESSDQGAPASAYLPPSGRGRVIQPPPPMGPPRQSGPPSGGWSVAPPPMGQRPAHAGPEQRPPMLPPRRQFDQRGPVPERAWSPPAQAPSERWAPRADTQVGQPTPRRSIKPEEVSKRRTEPAEIGWRKAVYAMSGGLVNLGAGKHEKTLRDWSALIKSNIPGNYQIAVVSVKGGVGKTRVTAGVGSVFGLERGQPVLAIDGNPTYGGLGRYVDSSAWTTIRDLLQASDQIVDYPTARQYTGRNAQGLEVLAGNQNTSSPLELKDKTFYDIARLTRRFYQLSLVDCGTEVETDFFKAVLSLSDALLIVGSCGVDGGLAIEQTVDWLAARGGHELLKRSVIVLNDATNSLDQKFEKHINETVAPRVRSVHVIPFDEHLRDGADLDYGALRKSTRLAFMDLAADLATGFPTAGALAAQ